MPRVNAALADISTKIEAMPEGTYAAVIKSVEHGKSSKSGVPMITVTYKLTEGDYAKRELKDYFTLQQKDGEPNEAGLRGLKRLIVAVLGEDRANDPEFDTDELLNEACQLVVKQESYEQDGEEGISNKVKRVMPA